MDEISVGEEYFVTLEEMGLIPKNWKQYPNSAMEALLTRLNHYMELADINAEYIDRLANWVEQDDHDN